MAIAFVDGANNRETGSSTSIGTSSTINLAAGNAVVVQVSCSGNATYPLSVTDTQNNTYTPVHNGTYASVHSMSIWVAYNCEANASNTVTATWSSGRTYRHINATQYSGLETASNPFDTYMSVQIDSNTTPHYTASTFTDTDTADELIYGFFAAWANISPYSDGPTCSEASEYANYHCSSYKVVDTAGTYTADIACNNGYSNVSIGATFRQAAAGVERSATITAAGTVAATGKAEYPRSATATAAGTVSATATREVSRSAAASASGTVAASATREVSRAATASASGTVSASATREVPRSATISAAASVSATGSLDTGIISRDATVSASGSVSAAGHKEVSRASTITAAGSASATGTHTPAIPPAPYTGATYYGGGSILRKGSLPEWWTEWETPEPHLERIPVKSLEQIIAEARDWLPKSRSVFKRRAVMRGPAVTVAASAQKLLFRKANVSFTRRTRRKAARHILLQLLR